eukprot:6180866-Pleurochrysis_carterae.AAC.1
MCMRRLKRGSARQSHTASPISDAGSQLAARFERSTDVAVPLRLVTRSRRGVGPSRLACQALADLARPAGRFSSQVQSSTFHRTRTSPAK